MTTIIYRDRAGGPLMAYVPKYPSQRSLYEETRNERIQNALAELAHVGNIEIYLYKRRKLRLIAKRPI